MTLDVAVVVVFGPGIIGTTFGDGGINFGKGVSVFEVAVGVGQTPTVVLELFWLNGDASWLTLAVFGVLFPCCDFTEHGATFDKSLLTSLFD